MSTSSSTESLEVKELNLVNKVELRIALADSDAKLEIILKTFLAPLLLKLASEHVSVRNKVISVCQHINTRIKPLSIKLPVASLLKQFKEQPTRLIRQFDLLYIQQGIDRIPISDRANLLPALIHDLAADASVSASHGASLFNLFLRLLPHFPLPQRGDKEDLELREKLDLVQRPDDAKFIAFWSGKLVLLSIGRSSDSMSGTSTKTTCPGLTPDEYSFLNLYDKSETWKPTEYGGLNLTETKIAVLNFLASGAFVDSERFLPALFASADTNSRISDNGEDMLKRVLPNISLEKSDLIQPLFELYFGHSETAPPVRSQLQLKIVGLFCKSIIATTYTAQITKLVEQGIIPSEINGERHSISLSGREALKLQGQVFAFTNWVARMGSPKDLNLLAPEVVSRLRDFIEQRGWPQPSSEGARSQSELSLRGYAYESIGLLAKACPRMLLEPNLDLLRWLFTSLSEEGSGGNIAVSVEEALGSVIAAFADTQEKGIQGSLRALLLHHMELSVGYQTSTTSTAKVRRSTRYIAVRYANRCLPYGDIIARWIDILAIGLHRNERSEVVEEGKKGLDLHWYRMLNSVYDNPSVADNDGPTDKFQLPDFAELVQYILLKPTNMGDNNSEDGRALEDVHTLAPSIAYCRRVLLSQAMKSLGSIPGVDADWERRQDTAIATDEDVRDRVKAHLREMAIDHNESVRQALYTYVLSSYQALTWNHGEGLGECGDHFVEICALSADKVIGQLVSRLPSLQGPIYSNSYTTRCIAAQAFGILASHEKCSPEVLQGFVQMFLKQVKLWRDAIGAGANKSHGAILALSYLFSRLSYRHRTDALPEIPRVGFLTEVLDVLENTRDKMLRDAANTAIDQLCLFSVLTLQSLPSSHSAMALIAKLMEDAKSGNERAIVTTGRFAMVCDEEDGADSDLNRILECLYGLHEIRQPESQFAVGEALAVSAVGWDSKSLIAALDIEGPRPSSPRRNLVLSQVLERILSDCKSTKPALKKASVIWLLCLVQYCGHLPPVLDRLRNCQAAFKGSLSDRDSLVQETASRGLSTVYEKGDKQLRDDLVRDLVGSFTSTTPNLVGNVTAETELFEPGALPTGDGSVTTYKDIMSLASEVGDPSLVYKFMSLAANNAIWSGRAAFGRFGLSSILSDSSVDGYLAQNPKLYSKLYRYRFDPNDNVRSSMNDIWAALVKDSTSTIDQYFDDIMGDLLSNILGKEWRVRQASCAAMADLVQGRPLGKYEKYLSQIWTQTFRVMDDVKSSVRDAAMSLARVLTSILIRSLEAGDSSSKSAELMLKNVLPFLLSPSGLESSATEVQAFALQTLLELIKKASAKTLRGFVPELVERLLGLLSSLEPQAVNYVHLNADKYGMTAQQIDDMRLTSIRSSPMMEAIERCLDLLDGPTMKDMCSSIQRAMKAAVGLPSKVGCSRVVVSLSTRHSFLFRVHADDFLQLVEKLVLDRNETVSSSYATACGYLVRLASDKQILRLLKFSRTLYFDSEDDRHRIVAGDIVYAASKYSTDRFSSMGTEFLPLTFVAKQDSHDHVKELFQNTWNENVGGSRAVLLYLQEILGLVTQHLDSPRWAIKHASALAVAEVVISSGGDISQVNAELIWPALEKALGGKTWDGKEKVLRAFVEFTSKTRTFRKSRPEIGAKMRVLMLREARRNSPSYRQHALLSLRDFVVVFNEVDMFGDVCNLVGPLIRDLSKENNEMDIDPAAGKESQSTIREKTVAAAVRALLNSLNPRIHPDVGASLSQILELLNITGSSRSRAVMEATFEGEEVLYGKLHGQEPTLHSENTEEILVQFARNLMQSMHQDDTESLRLKRANAILAFAGVSHINPHLVTSLEQGVTGARDAERSNIVRQKLDRALLILHERSP